MRLQRYLAASGVASRRGAEQWILAGRITLNGRTVRELGTSVAPGDVVACDGRVVAPPAEHAYLVMNKPLGVVTTMRDPEGRRTVADLIAKERLGRRVVPVGRLDYDTSGVLLLTDDGDLAHVLTHPRYGVEKAYRVTVRGRLDASQTAAIQHGVRLDDGRTDPARLRIVAANRERSVLDLTIHEGRNRQVRRMFEEVGHPVVALVRLRFGPLSLGDLEPGGMRPASEREIAALRQVAASARGPEENG